MSDRFIMPKVLITGKNALQSEQTKAEMLLAGKKALIVSGKVMQRIGNVKKVSDLLEKCGIGYAVFTDIPGEPTDVMVQEGYQLYCQEGCDFLIAIGGGSPIDTMKAIAVMAAGLGPVTEWMGKTIDAELPKMIAFPTTAGTGSEATQFTVITDSKRDIKMLLKGPCLIPDVAIVDYQLMMTSPKSVVAATGLDALTHAIEGYTSKKAQPMTDTFAISAIKRICRYLPVVYRDGKNTEGWEQMALAALEAGIVINNSSVTVVHGMSRPIGALFHVPHGMSNAMLLKECLSYVYDGTCERFAVLGREIAAADKDDSDEAAALKFIETVSEVVKICEIPSLEEYGIDRSVFMNNMDKMATDAIASGSPGNTRKALTKEDLIEIYKKLWR